MNAPILVECDHSSITVGWESNLNSVYELEMKENDEIVWKSLSNKLSQNTIRKKNLVSIVDRSNKFFDKTFSYAFSPPRSMDMPIFSEYGRRIQQKVLGWISRHHQLQ